jgi:hypothetical protein
MHNQISMHNLAARQPLDPVLDRISRKQKGEMIRAKDQLRDQWLKVEDKEKGRKGEAARVVE